MVDGARDQQDRNHRSEWGHSLSGMAIRPLSYDQFRGAGEFGAVSESRAVKIGNGTDSIKGFVTANGCNQVFSAGSLAEYGTGTSRFEYWARNAKYDGTNWVRLLAVTAAILVELDNWGNFAVYYSSDAGNTVGSAITWRQVLVLNKISASLSGFQVSQAYRAIAWQNADLDLNAAAWTDLSYDTETDDPNGDLNAGTGVYTCPVDGVYLVTGSAEFNLNADGDFAGIALVHSGSSNWVPDGGPRGTVHQYVDCSVATMFKCAAASTIRMKYYVTATHAGKELMYASFAVHLLSI